MQATNSMPASTLSFLDECHNIVLEHLQPLIKKMFESSDLAFIEFAEKAQSSDSQLHFFEAMTVIQKNRKNVEEIFYRELGRSFADFGCTSYQAEEAGNTGDESLTLLSKEETDIKVAIQNMVAGTALRSTQDMTALRQRLAVLNNGRQLEEEDIPGGATCLANAFHKAITDLMLEHQTRLIVYMLFNKFVLGKTATLYADYNKHLIEAGLLPNLKYEVRKNLNKAQVPAQAGAQEQEQEQGQEQGQGQGQGQAHSGAAVGPTTHTNRADNSNYNQSLGDELFGSIMQLLSRRDNQGQANAAGNQGQANATGNQGGQQSAISNPVPQTALVSALHQLQQTGNAANPVVSGNTGAVRSIRENNQLVAALVANLSAERDRLFDGIDRRRLPTADTQVIDLVGMMFEYMLKDNEIPSVAKAELSRLHTPYLKVAIIDNELFTNTNHPAHELLNTLAKSAARWVVESNLDRGIFPEIHNIVEQIIADFENNIDIFSELLTGLRARVRDMENKASALEKRTQQAAEGKDKLELARKYAAARINKCMGGHNVPAPIKKLLGDVWQEKLMFIYLREPEAEESDSWQLAIQAIEAIIWSVEPRTSLAGQTELREKLPEVQKQIALAFETLAAYGSNDNELQLALIRDIQEAILRAPVDESRTTEQANRPAPLDFRSPEAGIEVSIIDEDNAEPAEEQLSPETKAALAELKQIAFGTWFSIQEDEDTLPERVKLSWYSQMSGNYMFVDGMGMKAEVRKQTQLAALMASGKARIIQTEQQPLVQRALEAIRRMLGGEQRVPA
jgi:hypothetical protein